MKKGSLSFDREKCVYCGDCIKACPTEAWTAKRKGWAVRIGGKHGRHPRESRYTCNAVSVPDEKVLDFIGQDP